MSKVFRLEILTPERLFYEGGAEALTVEAPDGELTILADHEPLAAPLVIGRLRLKTEGEWREAFHSEGFVEVTPRTVSVFLQSCEWPEELEERRAAEARRRAEESTRQRQSLQEYKQSKIALARAMARLRRTKGAHKND